MDPIFKIKCVNFGLPLMKEFKCMLVNEGVPIFFVFGAQYLSRMWHEFHLSRIDLVSNSARGCGITYTVHFRNKEFTESTDGV